jgi:hypothetical protein
VRKIVVIATVSSWLAGTMLYATCGQAQTRAPDQSSASEETDWSYPTFELQGKLRDTFTISECSYISGMTCRIKYTGTHPLPSRVYFVEFDEKGNQAGPEVRLIYPRLDPGEKGWATFGIRLSSPARVRLRGEWKGPWQDPY